MTTLDYALAYSHAGLSVIPILPGGSKAPALPKGHDVLLRRRRATEAELRQWLSRTGHGVGVQGGAASGGLEVLDFEAAEAFLAWRAVLDVQLPGLVGRLPRASTPGGGAHVYYRCGAPEGSQKLAHTETGKTLVETRGEGGYVLAPGCPTACHATGRLYEWADGPPASVPAVSEEERAVMLAAAAAQDRQPRPRVAWDTPPAAGPGGRPGDDYNRRAAWEDVLSPHGWEAQGRSGETVYWRRPGKEGRGTSATTGHCKSEAGGDLLYVFSSNAAPLEPQKGYSRFAAYCLLNHAGDYTAAARALAGKGYGEQRRPLPPTNGHVSGNGPAEDGAPCQRVKTQLADVATIADLERAGSEVRWLWKYWVQTGTLTALAAEGGKGKTRFCADLLRRMRHGLPWPDGSPMTAPRDALALWVVADNHHDEMVTLARDFGITGGIYLNAHKADPYGGVSLDAVEDLWALESRIEAVRPALVIVDTVGNATDKNLSRQEEAKAFYFPLQVLARRHSTAILCLTHLNAAGKFLGRRVMEKVRVAIQMEQPDPEDPRRSLAVVKSNGKRPNPLGLRMTDGGNEYDNSPPRAPEGLEPGQAAPSKNTSVDRCRKWLHQQLRGGSAKVHHLRDMAEGEGFSSKTLYAAKAALPIHQFELEGKKWWQLTDDDEDE